MFLTPARTECLRCTPFYALLSQYTAGCLTGPVDNVFILAFVFSARWAASRAESPSAPLTTKEVGLGHDSEANGMEPTIVVWGLLWVTPASGTAAPPPGAAGGPAKSSLPLPHELLLHDYERVLYKFLFTRAYAVHRIRGHTTE